MRNGLHILVPVLVVHVINDQTGGQGQVFLLGLDAACGGNLADDNNLCAVWREEEALQVALVIELCAVCSVNSHGPQVSLAQVGDAFSAVQKGGLRLAVLSCGQHLASVSVCLNQADAGLDLVGLDVRCGYCIGNVLAVGACYLAAYAVHGPQFFGCQQIVLCHSGRSGHGCPSQGSRSHDSFHFYHIGVLVYFILFLLLSLGVHPCLLFLHLLKGFQACGQSAHLLGVVLVLLAIGFQLGKQLGVVCGLAQEPHDEYA